MNKALIEIEDCGEEKMNKEKMTAKELIEKKSIELLPYNSAGWSWVNNAKQLVSLMITYPNIKNIIEIGSFTGACSTTLLGVYAKARGGKIICIDPCLSNSFDDYNQEFWGIPEWVVYPKDKMFEHFISNVTHNGIDDIVIPMACTSEEFFKLEPEKDIDMVYIDGSHDYEVELEDIRNAFKHYPDAIICGDDYNLPNVFKAVDNAAKELDKLVHNEDEFWIME